ncbi:hypothetical protein Bbelb_040600 [Branchiostoma belcheri]|nr:hypothetical protein Bbelb_040600 [Branchiostoma belcheri]
MGYQDSKTEGLSIGTAGQMVSSRTAGQRGWVSGQQDRGLSIGIAGQGVEYRDSRTGVEYRDSRTEGQQDGVSGQQDGVSIRTAGRGIRTAGRGEYQDSRTGSREGLRDSQPDVNSETQENGLSGHTYSKMA